MLNISKFPVLIISNYRTGSSALSECIGQNYNIPSIVEPIQWPNKMLTLINMIKNNNLQFCCKFHIDQIQPGDVHSRLLEMNSYKIKITRNDLVAQITSYYIASVRNIWKQNTESIGEYTVPIDNERLTELAKIIIDNNNRLNTCDIEFDEEVVYEDQNFSLQERFKTTQPTNIDEITNAVTLSINNLSRLDQY